jgi:antitoxin (DNA-binding transcriptional repressor) of toxin-antitoxin stability system
MVSVSIRELHMNTGKWVRGVSEPIVITERGHPVAMLTPFVKSPARSFRDRKIVPGFAELKPIDSDSGRFLEEDRR